MKAFYLTLKVPSATDPINLGMNARSFDEALAIASGIVSGYFLASGQAAVIDSLGTQKRRAVDYRWVGEEF